ncbi:MAG: hypothetical protein D6812_11000, partial [Deltaproteobacteria bacterium]
TSSPEVHAVLPNSLKNVLAFNPDLGKKIIDRVERTFKNNPAIVAAEFESRKTEQLLDDIIDNFQQPDDEQGVTLEDLNAAFESRVNNIQEQIDDKTIALPETAKKEREQEPDARLRNLQVLLNLAGSLGGF